MTRSTVNYSDNSLAMQLIAILREQPPGTALQQIEVARRLGTQSKNVRNNLRTAIERGLIEVYKAEGRNRYRLGGKACEQMSTRVQ